MHPFHIPQCSIQSRNVHNSVLNGALQDMEIGLLHNDRWLIALREPLLKDVELKWKNHYCKTKINSLGDIHLYTPNELHTDNSIYAIHSPKN